MPNVGWGELILIMLVALLVFGPKRLPEMARSLGRAFRNFQQESSKALEQLRDATEAEPEPPPPLAASPPVSAPPPVTTDGAHPPYEDT